MDYTKQASIDETKNPNIFIEYKKLAWSNGGSLCASIMQLETSSENDFHNL